ncbi:unnamed protein product [Clonostachys chloroleuca]|uniref:Zn(2)-C6 fungal-type domain-containing protein n=1 Tax=Clonostachys chloroleuca TaxID=1926264 RepID=A0AA35MIV4_9HYPO|nr:unnamed protein product [Clonostachys chloroleuca]
MLTSTSAQRHNKDPMEMDTPLPQPPPSRRRKVRKGTFSCWECKRRKRRCELKPGSSSACVSCQRRGLPCLSQEEYEPQTGPEQVSERICHVENLIGVLLDQRRQQHGAIGGAAALTIPPSPSGSSLSITTYLYSVLPSPSDTISILSHGNSFRMPQWSGWARSAPLLEPPPLEAQPIWYGRRLMHLALRLQDSDVPGWNASKYAQIVAHCVSSIDALVSSTDGIETLMLEAMYYVNDGKLQEAWLRCRRAMSIAQLLGLDRAGWTNNAILRRLIFGDRVMSLELGVTHFGIMNYGSLDSVDPVTRLEKIHVLTATRIIERNLRMMDRSPESIQAETLGIDQIMKKAMKDLPSGWWSASTKKSLSALSEEEAMKETMKLISQVNHYWILTQLHQPPIMLDLFCPVNLGTNLYSRTVLASSCRQVLSRFLLIRKYHGGGLYRGADSKAVSASIGLLLAHIDGHRDSTDNALEHLRPQDIDLIRDSLDLFEVLSRPQSERSIVQSLLAIESNAVGGTNYMFSMTTEDALRFTLPYFGTMSLVPISSELAGREIESLSL